MMSKTLLCRSMRAMLSLLLMLTTVDVLGMTGLDLINSTLRNWEREIPKQNPLITVLGGDCDLHRQVPVSLAPGLPVKYVTGGRGVFERITDTLRQSCNSIGCPSQIVFVTSGDTIPSEEMREMAHVFFFNGKRCTTPEFGGFACDCSRIWFIISTCFGSDQFELAANELERIFPRFEDVLHDVQRSVRLAWSVTDTLVWNIRVVIDDKNRESNLDSLAREVIHKLRSDEEKDAKIHVAPVKMKTLPHSPIDLSVLSSEASGYSGQEWARTAVERALTAVQKNQKMNKGPIVFFFLGPAGTGKTMLAKLVARAYHNGEEISTLEARGDFRIFSMASYKSEEDVDAFVSPRAGLVGEGSMIDVFKQSKRPVIVLDEIEKAHSKLISEMLLSWIDDNDGFVQDKKDSAKRYSTENAIFILTSNCFAQEVTRASQNGSIDPEITSARLLTLLRSDDSARSPQHAPVVAVNCNAFKREEVMRRMMAGHALAELARFGFIIFLPPGPKQVDEVVLRFLQDYKRKHHERTGGGFFWTKRALALLTKGARRDVLHSKALGGLSTVVSGLYEKLGKAVRIALTVNDVELGPTYDVLLYQRDLVLVARVVSNAEQGIVSTPQKCDTVVERSPSVLWSPAAEQEPAHHRTLGNGWRPESNRFEGPTHSDVESQQPTYETGSVSDGRKRMVAIEIDVERDRQEHSAVDMENEGRQAVDMDTEVDGEFEQHGENEDQVSHDYMQYLNYAVMVFLFVAFIYFFSLLLGFSVVKALVIALSFSSSFLLAIGAGYMCLYYPDICVAFGQVLRYGVLPIITAVYQMFGPKGILGLFVILFVLPYSWIQSLCCFPIKTSALAGTSLKRTLESHPKISHPPSSQNTPEKLPPSTIGNISPSVKRTKKGVERPNQRVKTPYGYASLVRVRSEDDIHVVKFELFKAIGYLRREDVVALIT